MITDSILIVVFIGGLLAIPPLFILVLGRFAEDSTLVTMHHMDVLK